MASRIISWQQLVQETDPNWQRKLQRPYWYEFSNGRRFDWNGDKIYTQTSV